MAISSDMVKWLNKNICMTNQGLQGMEHMTGIDWKLRFQDFTDDNLKNYFDHNDGERRWPFILEDLGFKAHSANMRDIEHHLNGFADEEAFQGFMKKLKEKQAKFL